MVARHLESLGLRTWYAPRDVPFGDEWPKTVAEAIRTSSSMVLLFESQADASIDVMREITIADRNHVPILWLRCEQIDPRGLEYYLASRQGYDWLEAGSPVPSILIDTVRQFAEDSPGRSLGRDAQDSNAASRSGSLDALGTSRSGNVEAWPLPDVDSMVGEISEFRSWCQELESSIEYAGYLATSPNRNVQYRAALRLGWYFREIDWNASIRFHAFAYKLQPNKFTKGALQESLWHSGRHAQALGLFFEGPRNRDWQSQALAMAEVLLGQGRPDLARQVYEHLLKQRTGVKASLGMAKTFEVSGRREEAIESYKWVQAQGRPGTVGEARQGLARLTNSRSRSKIRLRSGDLPLINRDALPEGMVDANEDGFSMENYIVSLDDVQRRALRFAAFIAAEVLYRGPHLDRVGYPVPRAFPDYILSDSANVPEKLVPQLLPVHSPPFHSLLSGIAGHQDIRLSESEGRKVSAAFADRVRSLSSGAQVPAMALREDCFNMATVVLHGHSWLGEARSEAASLLQLAGQRFVGGNFGIEATKHLRDALLQRA
jgi:hypothetical protein